LFETIVPYGIPSFLVRVAEKFSKSGKKKNFSRRTQKEGVQAVHPVQFISVNLWMMKEKIKIRVRHKITFANPAMCGMFAQQCHTLECSECV